MDRDGHAPAITDDGGPSRSDRIELFEMANLASERTGIGETIYMSTAQSGHDERVMMHVVRSGRREQLRGKCCWASHDRWRG